LPRIKSNFIKRPVQNEIAQQAAYGIVGKFSSPPVNKDQFVLMDFRPNHLNNEEKLSSPSFLYAMDLGNETFFVEETSLASYPALSQENLKKRLFKRLNSKGIQVSEILHEENCLFPMNLPLPFKKQFVLGFGGSASMVHPASGYMIGSLLRRAPLLAEKLAIFLKEHIAIINPKILILMGSTAMEAITGLSKISNERGKWKEIILKNKTIPIMISFSPSYLIRFPENKKFSWEDLKKIKQKIQDLNIRI